MIDTLEYYQTELNKYINRLEYFQEELNPLMTVLNIRVILFFRLISVKQNLPSKLKFIIVVSIHYWSSQISPFEKGSSDFYSQRAGFLKAKNTLNY